MRRSLPRVPQSHPRPAHDCGVDCAAEHCGAGGGRAIAASPAGAGMGGVDDFDSISLWAAAWDRVFAERGHAGGNAAGAVQVLSASGLEERTRVQCSGGVFCAEPAGLHLCDCMRMDCGAVLVSAADSREKASARCEFIWRGSRCMRCCGARTWAATCSGSTF